MFAVDLNSSSMLPEIADDQTSAVVTECVSLLSSLIGMQSALCRSKTITKNKLMYTAYMSIRNTSPEFLP